MGKVANFNLVGYPGTVSRSIDNITAYIPDDGSLQKIFLCATTAKVVATASIGVDTPAYGQLVIKKTLSGNQAAVSAAAANTAAGALEVSSTLSTIAPENRPT